MSTDEEVRESIEGGNSRRDGDLSDEIKDEGLDSEEAEIVRQKASRGEELLRKAGAALNDTENNNKSPASLEKWNNDFESTREPIDPEKLHNLVGRLEVIVEIVAASKISAYRAMSLYRDAWSMIRESNASVTQVRKEINIGHNENIDLHSLEDFQSKVERIDDNVDNVFDEISTMISKLEAKIASSNIIPQKKKNFENILENLPKMAESQFRSKEQRDQLIERIELYSENREKAVRQSHKDAERFLAD